MQKLLCILFCLSMAMGKLWAQNRTVTGKVTDEKGAPISGASVIVKGSGTGTTSNEDGSFRINVPVDARTLIFSALNVPAKEVGIGTSSTVNVILSTEARRLDEVVVTALGITRDRRSLGYATQSLKSEDIIDKGEINIVNALQGKIAGVDITGAGGAAGASANINIRGITSFGSFNSSSNQPLFVVDGIPISNDVDRTGNSLFDQQPSNRALDLNMNDVETVNVLKGPAASVLYGSRASAGAIIITTKKGAGAKGKVNVTLASSYTNQQVSGLPEFQNDYGSGVTGLYNPLSGNSWGPRFGSTPSLANGLIINGVPVTNYRAYPNNIRNFYETGSILENNLNVTSGDAKQNVGLSIGNTNQIGFLPNTKLNRTNVGVKFNTMLGERFSLGSSINYISTNQTGILQGNSLEGGLISIYGTPRSMDLDFYKQNYKNPDGSFNWPVAGRENPYFNAYENPLTSRLSRTTGNVKVGYDFADWLNVSYRLGIDAYTDRRKRIVAIGSLAASGKGRVMEDNFFRSELNGDLIISAKKDKLFVEGLNANFLVGQNINNRVYQNVTVDGTELVIPGYYNVSNAGVRSASGERNETRRILGYYAQASFAYNNILFLELTGRADQSSTLPKNKNLYFYPSIAGSFVFTDALHLKSDFLSYGKVRANIARVGRDADVYLLQSTYLDATYGNTSAALFNFPYSSTLGFTASSQIGNANLQPEFTTSYEVGVNLGLLKNRLTIDATYFYSSSTNQIIAVGISPSSGFLTEVSNTGEIVNKGVELLLNGTIISNRNFRWDASLNFTRIRNKVVSIGNGVISTAVNGFRFGNAVPSIVEGEPYGVIIGLQYQRSPDGQLLINPASGLPLGTNAGKIIADPNRDWNAGLTNTLKYKNLSLSLLLDYKQGGDIVSWGAIAFRSNGSLKETGVDRDQPRIFPGVIQTADGKYVPNNIQIPAQTYWQGLGQTSGAGEFGVFDATTFRLREVSLGVELPGGTRSRKIFSTARFTVFGRNLFYYAPNAPFDPEMNTQGAGNSRGLELQSAFNARSLGASLRLTF
ncbi:SusC/RagA family TonB-linked outer membrane protein [Segetibacter sp. 3557_3]|uniref:SusC/RagA family TonB-linked outer membrane protein n=1 Tax=Segetibacter sp. 3557_3 TaxID=2547429 RepID=UPI0010587E5A|nr:SusC/RagA family TonB-linked outer membrane protein [Segetibacter sp. 3557_3]TDH24075.1 SusC/RagA family TonB-linked outer membrane protein [Segetibacter sp. 3557_3]